MHACAYTHTKGEAEMQACTEALTHTWWSSAAKEGFVPRLLESDISMALSGVSMAILCTEMKRGDTRLGPGLQRGPIYISSRAVKAPPLSVPLLSCFSITVCASLCPPSQPPLLHPLFPKKTLLPLPLCAASSHNPLTVAHTVFLGVKLLCSLLYRSLLILKLPCWYVFLSFLPSFLLPFLFLSTGGILPLSTQAVFDPPDSELCYFPPKKERKKNSLPPQWSRWKNAKQKKHILEV